MVRETNNNDPATEATVIRHNRGTTNCRKTAERVLFSDATTCHSFAGYSNKLRMRDMISIKCMNNSSNVLRIQDIQ